MRCEEQEAPARERLRLAREQTEEANVRALLETTRKQLMRAEDNTRETEREYQVYFGLPCLPEACMLPSGSLGSRSLRGAAVAGGVTDSGVGWYRISKQTRMSRQSTACTCSRS